MRARLVMAACLGLPLVLLFGHKAEADSYAWMAAGNGEFGILDLTSGVFKSCPLNTNGDTFAGLATTMAPRRLYAQYFQSQTFGRLEPAKGIYKAIGNNNIAVYTMGSADDVVYEISAPSARGASLVLYSVNVTSGAGTLIGPTGLMTGSDNWIGMSNGAKELYLYYNGGTPNNQHGGIYKLNILTGKAKKVVAETFTAGPMVKVGDVMYIGVQNNPLQIDSLNLKTGAVAVVSNVSNETAYFLGLSPAFRSTCTKQ